MLHGCYQLSHIWNDADQTWEAVAINVKMFLQCGHRYGILWFKMKCHCCDHLTIRDFFFTMHESDEILKKMRPRTRPKGRIVINLPTKEDGLFRVLPKIQIDDNYILKNMAITNYCDARNGTLTRVFEEMRRRVQMQAALRRLRRCARRAKTTAFRMAALSVLRHYGIEEAGIRMDIVSHAKLW